MTDEGRERQRQSVLLRGRQVWDSSIQRWVQFDGWRAVAVADTQWPNIRVEEHRTKRNSTDRYDEF